MMRVAELAFRPKCRVAAQCCLLKVIFWKDYYQSPNGDAVCQTSGFSPRTLVIPNPESPDGDDVMIIAWMPSIYTYYFITSSLFRDSVLFALTLPALRFAPYGVLQKASPFGD